MKTLGPIAFSIVMGLIGIVCLIWPSRIQRYALKSASVSKFNPFFEWMKKPAYLVSLRVCGIIAFLMALFVLWILITNRS